MKKKYIRSIFYAKMSVVYNGVLAVGKLLTGIFTLSFFLCVNAFYSCGIGLAKFFAVKIHKETLRQGIDFDASLHAKRKNSYYFGIGFIVLLSSIVYILYCIRMFVTKSDSQYHMVVALAITAFTFTEIVLSLRGIFTTRRDNELVVEAIKMTNLASSMISLVLTQTAIMSFTHEGDASFYNGLSGIIFGSVAALIGVYMLVHMYRIQKGKTAARLIKRVERFVKKADPQTVCAFIGVEDIQASLIKIFYRTEEGGGSDVSQCLRQNLKDKFNVELINSAHTKGFSSQSKQAPPITEYD